MESEEIESYFQDLGEELESRGFKEPVRIDEYQLSDTLDELF